VRPSRLVPIVGVFLGIAVVHLLVGRGTHALHIVHVVFGALYLVPIVAAALWLGGWPAIVLATASAATHLVHSRTAWSGDPNENANQLAMAAVHLFVGAVTALLVRAAERERRSRLEVERSAEREALVQGIATLSSALRQRDDGTGAHCARVAAFAVRIGAALGLPPDRLELLRLASLAHDVGKIGVRDDILLKTVALTLEERSRIERHPAIAADILRQIRGAEELAEIVLSHHECPDGSGYPRGLLGDRIPVEARILRVADVFAALVEPRSYKAAMSMGEALQRMRELAGKLDPVALRALEQVVAAGDIAGAQALG
jgi:putative nucleotidyltransferase with HDIG domain